MSLVSPKGHDLRGDVVPIFTFGQRGGYELRDFRGTGFLAAPGVLLTCDHCVRDYRDDELFIAVVPDGDGYEPVPMRDIRPHGASIDIAIASVDREPSSGLRLSAELGPYHGVDVCTFGYPLTGRTGADAPFMLNARYLEGYTTRMFMHKDDKERYAPAKTIEIDMPAPAGLSGAPLIRRRSRDVVGIVTGAHDVSSIAELSTVDPETGERTAEIRRTVSFAHAIFAGDLLAGDDLLAEQIEAHD